MDTIKDQEGTIIYEFDTRKIIRYGDRVVKSGRNLRASEVANMRFVAENTTIPVPKVHDVQYDEDGNINAIMMDYMPGQTLDKAWPDFNTEQKVAIADELHSYVNQLRALKGDYIGAAGRGKVIVGRITSREGGPFDTEEQFNEFIVEDMRKGVPAILRHYASFALSDGHEIVFTHADLFPRNIIVQDGHVTAILDWEYGGWYPAYWEYTQCLRSIRPMEDWPDYLPRILPPQFEKEWVGMSWLGLLLTH